MSSSPSGVGGPATGSVALACALGACIGIVLATIAVYALIDRDYPDPTTSDLGAALALLSAPVVGVLALVAIALAVRDWRRARRSDPPAPAGVALAALVLGIVGLAGPPVLLFLGALTGLAPR